MPEQQTKVLQWPATCYYVQEPLHKWWGYFTVIPEIGLLQVFCDFGTFTDNFADRWSSPGPDFKQFLIDAGPQYTANCLERTAAQYDDRAGWRKSVERRVAQMMLHLWPLFIEQLKAEREQAKEAV